MNLLESHFDATFLQSRIFKLNHRNRLEIIVNGESNADLLEEYNANELWILPPYTVSNSENPIEQANFDVFDEYLEKQGYYTDYAVIQNDEIFIRMDLEDYEIEKMLISLEEYPCLNDTYASYYEIEFIKEDLDNFIIDELKSYIESEYNMEITCWEIEHFLNHNLNELISKGYIERATYETVIDNENLANEIINKIEV